MNLVAQGPAMTPQDAQDLSRLTAARAETVAHRAFRFAGVSKNDAISSWCEARQIDCAWMPEGCRFKDLKLLAMDMDSTLITVECIDELADLAGSKTEVAGITAQAMRGEIDFPESLRRRVVLLKGLQESALERVYRDRLKLTAGAEHLISACQQSGVRLLLVSGGFTYFTERLKSLLGFDHTLANSLAIENGLLTGRLTGAMVDAGAKAAKFLSLMNELGATREQTVAIGDGANDLKMMALAGVSVAFRAKPAVQAQASCALNFSGLDGVLNLFEQVPRRAA